MSWLCLARSLDVVVVMFADLNPCFLSSEVMSGTSFAHLFNGVCWERVMPSDGVNIATAPVDCVTVPPSGVLVSSVDAHPAVVSRRPVAIAAAMIFRQDTMRRPDMVTPFQSCEYCDFRL